MSVTLSGANDTLNGVNGTPRGRSNALAGVTLRFCARFPLQRPAPALRFTATTTTLFWT